MGFYSTHEWLNGCIVTAELLDDGAGVSLRIQDEQEQMLCDIELGEHEALCIAHSILSVLTKGKTN